MAAGSVVKPGTNIPSGKLGGVPSKEIRDINDKEKEWIRELSNNYVRLSTDYLESNNLSSGSLKIKQKGERIT